MRWAVALLALAAMPAAAHRLDEYLQGALISVDRNRLSVEMTLTPGAAVFPFVMAEIDTDGNGALSWAEQRTYADRVLGDLSIAIDGHRLKPELLSVRFPAVEEMKEGRGEIHMEFTAPLPPGHTQRELTFENRHQNRISAYLVNALAPQDPGVRIVAQNRNYTQSIYRLEYILTGQETAFIERRFVWLLPIALLVIGRLMFLLQRRHQLPGLLQ